MANITGIAATNVNVYASAVGDLVKAITGTGACTVVVFGGTTSDNITFRYSSRAIFPDTSKCQFFEYVAAEVKCKFDDTLSFQVTGKTDEKRDKAVTNYATSSTTINNKTASGHPQYRNFISAVFPPGLDGNFIQTEIDKVVHHENGFDFSGLNCFVAGRKGMSSEFVTGSTELLEGWD